MLLMVMMVLLCGAGLFTTWRILDAVGRNALYKSAQENVPTLAQAAAAENEQENTAGQESSSKVWKDGWVRYQDKVYEYNDQILTFLVMGIDDMNYASAKSGGQSGGQADSLCFFS